MSKSGEKASEKEQDESQNDSVFDFLYCDTRRIGSFLAQFDDAGHLERVTQRESAAKKTKRGLEFTVGGGATLLGTGGQASLGVKRGPTDEGSESSERVYDPLWTNARTFLDYLHGAKLLHRDASKARIGQFALVSGTLAIFDLSLLKSAWELPFVRDLIKAAMGETDATPGQRLNRQQRKAGGQSHIAKQKSSPSEAVLGMLQFLPHGIIASIQFDTGSVWCNLNSINLVGSSSDVLLKHGVSVPGNWNVVGIVDAYPDAEVNEATNAYRTAMASAALGSLGALIMTFGPAIRMMLGRPNEAFGVTPLLIFREISG